MDTLTDGLAEMTLQAHDLARLERGEGAAEGVDAI